MFQPLWATLTTTGVGAATWIGVAMIGGRREAWDSEIYFAAMPLIGIIGGVVAYIVPARSWRWAFFPFLAQAVVMFIQSLLAGASVALLPVGLIVFAIFGAFCMIPVAIGAAFGRNAAAR
jgi:hypothetical protein